MNRPATQALSGLAQALFAPRAIALIGASTSQGGLASRPARVLARHGYAGPVAVIDPNTPPAPGSAVLAIPTGVDQALIMTPATSVLRTVEACAAAGVRVATVLTSGFAESGAQGQRRQQKLAQAARRLGVRILGPNSLGMVNLTDRVALSANSVFEHEVLRPGGLGVISQSGSMLGGLLTRAQARGMGFSKLVSVGSECDLGVGEIASLLVDDPATEAILLFLEGLRDPRGLATAARRAHAAGKPMIAYKLGRSRTARELAMTHTGAALGHSDLSDAFFREHGILRVRVLEALFESPLLVKGYGPAARSRMGIVTVSAGAAAMVLDGLADRGIAPVPPPPAVLATLAARRIRGPAGPVIDLPMGRADDGAYAEILDALLESEHCDVVLAVLGSNAAHDPVSARERILAARQRCTKPLAVFVGPQADETLDMLQAEGVAAFRTPESCADALNALSAWRPPLPADNVDESTRDRVARAVRSLGSACPNELEAARLFLEIGIATAPTTIVNEDTKAPELAFPVAAKVLSRDIPHKAEVGGVTLDIASPTDVPRQVAALKRRVAAARPQARIEGVILQSMQRGRAELLLGYRRDAEVGPVVALGLGGRLAAMLPAPVVRCAPVSVETARSMVGELPPGALPEPPDTEQDPGLEALVRAVHAFSLLALAEHPYVIEAEINPLILADDDVVGVDALCRLSVVPPR